MPTISKNAERLVEALNRVCGDVQYTDTLTGSRWHTLFTCEPGQARDRIVKQTALVGAGEQPDWTREQRSVRCFVERKDDGLILYAGSYKSPAKWKDGPASEFTADEVEAYAQFTRDRGWGYKGDRKAWEDRLVDVDDDGELIFV